MRNRFDAWLVNMVLLMLLAASNTFSQSSNAYDSSRRAVLKQDASAIPQFTIQIDDYSSLTAAVEFGYELPFSEDSLGLARYQSDGVYRYILALGTFYSVEEAEEVLSDMCPALSLNDCQVRYLGDLESLESESSGDDDQFAVMSPVESVPEVREEPLPDFPIEDLSIVNGVVSDFGDRVYDGEIVYTVQVAAMYEVSDANNVADKIPGNLGLPEIIPIYSAKGNVVYSVTIGRFAYKKNGQAFADDLCDTLDLVNCWVKPLSLIEKTKVDEW